MRRMPSAPQFRIRGIEPAAWERFIARLKADHVRPGEFFYRAIHRYAAGDSSLELPPKTELPTKRANNHK